MASTEISPADQRTVASSGCLGESKLISPGTFRSNVFGGVRPREQDESANQANEDQIEQPQGRSPDPAGPACSCPLNGNPRSQPVVEFSAPTGSTVNTISCRTEPARSAGSGRCCRAGKNYAR